MTSSPPMIRQISWMAVIPQVIALALAITVGEYLTPAKPMNGMMWGAAAYLLYSFGSRRLIPRHQSPSAVSSDLPRQYRTFSAALSFLTVTTGWTAIGRLS